MRTDDPKFQLTAWLLAPQAAYTQHAQSPSGTWQRFMDANLEPLTLTAGETPTR
jgi:hypothetical protein